MSSGNSTSAYDDFRGIDINNENATGFGLWWWLIITADSSKVVFMAGDAGSDQHLATTADEEPPYGIAFFTHTSG